MSTFPHLDYGCGRIIPDPPTNCRHYTLEGEKIKRYDEFGNRLYGKPKKVKLKPVTKIPLKTSYYLDEKRCLWNSYYWTRERIDSLPLLSRWTMAESPGTRQEWISWALDRMSVLKLTPERLIEQIAVQRKNRIYTAKDLGKLEALVERLRPGKSVSTILNR